MRRLLSLVLLGASTLFGGFAVAQDKPVEYNVSTCSPGRGATEFHAVVSLDKFAFTYTLANNVVEKITADLSVPLTVSAASKNLPEGTVRIESDDKDGGGLVGFIYQGRIAIAFTDKNGDLLMVAFGQVGSVDDMVKTQKQEEQFCSDLTKQDADSVIQALGDYLVNGYPKPTTESK